MDRATFFAFARRAPFGGRLTQAQVEGVETVLDAWSGDDDRHLAYILATAFHETGGKMQPVREGFAKTDAGARRAVSGRAYAVVVNGHVYYGRGLVQLTWERNYRVMGERLGLDLVNDPDKALEPDVSARILIEGMEAGLFTGKRLSTYFSGTKDDPEGARRIVNGTDKASLIAGYHHAFLDSIKAAREEARKATPTPAPVVKAAQPDAPPLAKDKATIGTTIAGLGGIGGLTAFARPILESINNPWAFLALVLIVVMIGGGLWLYFTGRLSIRRKAGA